MKTEHAIDWRKTAAEIQDDYERVCIQRDDLLAAIENVEKVKGRYHTEIAWRRLADIAKEIARWKGQQ